jgi:hypothetical protein
MSMPKLCASVGVPPLEQLVLIGDACGQLGGVMESRHVGASGEHDLRGLSDRRLNQEIGRRERLPQIGEMLADPGLRESEAIRLLDHFQVPFEAPLVPAGRLGLRRAVAGHEKESELHLFSPLSMVRV